MALGIFLALLLLMATVDVKKLHFSSDEKGIVCEKERREEIFQRLKEQEVSLQLLYSCLKKEIADLEAKQEPLTRPTLALERKIQQIQQRIHKVLFLAAITLLSLWREHLQEVTCQHNGEQPDAVFLGKAWKRVAFPDNTLCTDQMHSHPCGQNCSKSLFSYTETGSITFEIISVH